MYAGWKNKLFKFSSNFYISKVDKNLFIAIIQPCQRAKKSANSSDKAISAYHFGKISIGVILMKVLILCMGVACLFDLWQYRIPNICILCGLFIRIIVCIKEKPEQLPVLFLQMLIVFCFFYPFYLCRGLGAGDVKLFMLMAAYLTEEKLIAGLLLTFFLAAAVSLVKMLYCPTCRERLLYFLRYVRKLMLTGVADIYEVDKTKTETLIRLALPAFFSVVWVTYGGFL